MQFYYVIASVFSIAVLVSYVNYRFIKLQSTIATTLAALLISIVVLALTHLGFTQLQTAIITPIKNISFENLLLKGMLSFLLFAGALNINFNVLKNEKWEVAILAIFGTLASTLIIALSLYYTLRLFHHPLPLIYCFLFGSLISPTDPIAVLAIFKKLNAPKKLDARLAGESLFNDGVGVVLFISFLSMASSAEPITLSHAIVLFFREALGGIAYGFILGYFAYGLIKSVHEYKLEILITLVIVTGGYVLAQALVISGPLAMVVSGIYISYRRGKSTKMITERTRTNLDHFWELIDDALNAILFLLIGLELTTITFSWHDLPIAIAALIIVLLARVISVGFPMTLLRFRRKYNPLVITLMVWGGLRGGLALAMALSLPDNHYRNHILVMTYFVVIFSILVQGLTIKPLVAASKRMEKKR
jgi:CPA1 family monovalent cation:H+ antiporter